MKAEFASLPARKIDLNGNRPGGQLPDYFGAANDLDFLFFSLVARKLEGNPALLEIPLRNIDCWLAQSHPGRERLLAWQSMIEQARISPDAFVALLALLRGSSAEAIRWKGFSPFAGVLSPTEMDTLPGLS